MGCLLASSSSAPSPGWDRQPCSLDGGHRGPRPCRGVTAEPLAQLGLLPSAVTPELPRGTATGTRL